MRLSILAVGSLCVGLAVAASVSVPGCGGDDNNNGGNGGAATGGVAATGGARTGGAGTTGGAAATGGGGMDAGGTGGAMGAAVKYADVKPIFMAKCGACHVTGGPGAAYHTLATSSADANKNSFSCPGKKKGACTLERVKMGTMPRDPANPNMNPCTGNPTMDAGKEKCLTQADQDKLQAWIDGGLME